MRKLTLATPYLVTSAPGHQVQMTENDNDVCACEADFRRFIFPEATDIVNNGARSSTNLKSPTTQLLMTPTMADIEPLKFSIKDRSE